MDKNEGDVNQRLKNEIYGQPKIKPDEQRRFMGTFRERVWLTISVSEIQERDWIRTFDEILQKHPNSLVIINGNIDDRFTSKYLTAANQLNVDFTIKTGAEVKTGADDLAIVVTAHEAVWANPIDVAKLGNQSTPSSDSPSDKHDSLFKRLFHH